MSDIKHLEYCVRLGNELVKNKLEMLSNNNYQEPPTERNYNYKKEAGSNDNNSFGQDYYQIRSTSRDIDDFKARLKFEIK